MELRAYPYTLELKHQFTIASASRRTTPAMIVEVDHDGIVGYGEASLPPYLGETQGSVAEFLSNVDLTEFGEGVEMARILENPDRSAPGNTAAKAAVDIALHDWVGKKKGLPLHRMWGLSTSDLPQTSLTIGIDRKEIIRERVAEAEGFEILKLKLGGGHDRESIETVREVTDKIIRVDINQGWTDKGKALDMIEWLALRNVELVEQPLPKGQIDDLVWLRERSPLPIVGDEGVQRLSDVPQAKGVYDAINVKLMKCGGLREAYQMINAAKTLGMNIMLGCMTETSCAISAASQLASLAEWVDLDGALLIRNDLFDGVRIIRGRIHIPDRPGIGVVRLDRG